FVQKLPADIQMALLDLNNQNLLQRASLFSMILQFVEKRTEDRDVFLQILQSDAPSKLDIQRIDNFLIESPFFFMDASESFQAKISLERSYGAVFGYFKVLNQTSSITEEEVRPSSYGCVLMEGDTEQKPGWFFDCSGEDLIELLPGDTVYDNVEECRKGEELRKGLFEEDERGTHGAECCQD
ncbi:MAG: hypothetical protein AAF206_07640, partial [Bacteroidota bacterium]